MRGNKRQGALMSEAGRLGEEGNFPMFGRPNPKTVQMSIMSLSHTTRSLNTRMRLQALRQSMYCLGSVNFCGKGRTYATYVDNLPRVAQPSVWHSIVPKSFRNKDNSGTATKSQRSRDWNPATFFIWIFLLIGSNAIQMLALRNEYSTFRRKTDAKIALLKEVLDKIRRGEEVDVDKVLGTGDEQQEQEWADGRVFQPLWTL